MTYPKQSKSVHIEVLHDELCLYDWQRKEAHALNATAAQVWQMCDGATSPAQMAAQLRATQSPALNDMQAAALVSMSLQELTQAHLLAKTGAAGQNVLTRRQVLKALGGAAAGAVLLPAVSSIVAPRPVAAQSPAVPPAATATPTGPTWVQCSFPRTLNVGTLAANTGWTYFAFDAPVTQVDDDDCPIDDFEITWEGGPAPITINYAFARSDSDRNTGNTFILAGSTSEHNSVGMYDLPWNGIALANSNSTPWTMGLVTVTFMGERLDTGDGGQ